MEMLPGGSSEIVGMLPSGNSEIVGMYYVTKRVQVETPKWKCYQAETPKLWECYQAAGGNSEIVEMLSSGCRWKLRNGNATRRKLRNCGNVTKRVAEIPKLGNIVQRWEAGALRKVRN